MKKILLVALVLFADCSPGHAWTRGALPTPGNATINLTPAEITPYHFINVFKAGRLAITSLAAADIALINANGYLTSVPSASISIPFPSGSWTGVQYKLVWPSTIQFKMSLNITASGCSTTGGASVAGCSNSAITVTSGATGGSVTFTLVSGDWSATFLNSGTYSWSAGEIALYRVSDEAAYQSGEYFTPEFVNLLKQLRPGWIRPMEWTLKGSGTFNGETQWRYRVTPSYFCWRNGEGTVPPGAWAGAISGTDTYTVADTPDGFTLTDGALVIGRLTNTNTSTTPTLAVGANTAKTIIRQDGTAMTVGYMKASQLATFVYDAILDKLLYVGIAGTGSGLYGSIPIEAQIQLANRVGANLWANLPSWATDDYVTQWGTAALALRNDLYFTVEYSNEVWNPSFPQSNWANERGLALGFPALLYTNRPTFSYYALRVRQIMGNLVAPVWTGRNLKRVLMTGASQSATETINYRMKGFDLAPSGTSTGTGNAAYTTLTGGANYTAAGQRPVDFVEVFGYGSYSYGENVCVIPESGPGTNGICPVSTQASTFLPFYQALVNYWEAGNTAAAIAMIDDDIRHGVRNKQTVTASGTTFTTAADHGFTANSTNVLFPVVGGTSYSGLIAGMLYQVSSTPTTKTFTVKAYAGGVPSGSNVNAGSAGSGTVSVGTSTAGTFDLLASLYYIPWEAVAAGFDSDRPIGMSALKVYQYESDIEIGGLTSAMCGTVGVTGVSNATCAADAAAAIVAWKNSSSAFSTQKAFYTQFMGTDSSFTPTYGLLTHSQAPSQFALSCDLYYAIISGTTCNPTNTPYQTFYGIQSYNGGWLLKRDLDPASNDNDPMWLEKAA